MIVKRFGCTAIHNKALNKCIILFFYSILSWERSVQNYVILTELSGQTDLRKGFLK